MKNTMKSAPKRGHHIKEAPLAKTKRGMKGGNKKGVKKRMK